MLAVVYYALRQSVAAWTVLGVFGAAALLPAGTEWTAFRRARIWNTWHRSVQET